MTFICPDSLNMCSLSSYENEKTAGMRCSRRFCRLNVLATNLYQPTGGVKLVVQQSQKNNVDIFLMVNTDFLDD